MELAFRSSLHKNHMEHIFRSSNKNYMEHIFRRSLYENNMEHTFTIHEAYGEHLQEVITEEPYLQFSEYVK
jgi:hypothetical protein